METTLEFQKGIKESDTGFYIEVKVVANGDHGESFRPRKAKIHGLNLKDLKERQYQFVNENGIGGGNWTKTFVFNSRGEKIGRMSYNGRIWDANENEIVA